MDSAGFAHVSVPGKLAGGWLVPEAFLTRLTHWLKQITQPRLSHCQRGLAKDVDSWEFLLIKLR